MVLYFTGIALSLVIRLLGSLDIAVIVDIADFGVSDSADIAVILDIAVIVVIVDIAAIAVIVDIAVLLILLLSLYAELCGLVRSPVPGAWHVLCLFRRRCV